MYSNPFGSIYGDASLFRLVQKPKPGFLGDSEPKKEILHPVIPEIEKKYSHKLEHPKAQLVQAKDSKRTADHNANLAQKTIKKLETKKVSLQSLIVILTKLKSLPPVEIDLIVSRLTRLQPSLQKIIKAKEIKENSNQLSEKLSALDNEISRWEDLKELKKDKVPLTKNSQLVSVAGPAEFRVDETPKTALPIFKTQGPDLKAQEQAVQAGLKSVRQLGNSDDLAKKQLLKVIDDLPEKVMHEDNAVIQKKVEQTWVAAKEAQWKASQLEEQKNKLIQAVSALTEQAASLSLDLQKSNPQLRPVISSITLITELKPRLLEDKQPISEVLGSLKRISNLENAEAQADVDASDTILANAENELNSLSLELRSREHALATVKATTEGNAPPPPLVSVIKAQPKAEPKSNLLVKIIPLVIVLLILWRLTK